jgi:spore maturation protein SpmA
VGIGIVGVGTSWLGVERVVDLVGELPERVVVVIDGVTWLLFCDAPASDKRASTKLIINMPARIMPKTLVLRAVVLGGEEMKVKMPIIPLTHPTMPKNVVIYCTFPP